MKSAPRLLALAGTAALLAVAVYLAWPIPTVRPTPSVPPAVAGSESADFIPPAPPTPEEMKTAAALTPEFPDINGGPPLLPALPLQKGELPWEARVRSVIEAEGVSAAQRAEALLRLMPSLPVEGRQTATEEAVKILPSRDYRPARDALTNPGTYGPALNVLFADLMDRPPEITLPTLLQIARIAQHPFAPSARENLQLLLGQDYGADWNRWDAAIRAALAQKK